MLKPVLFSSCPLATVTTIHPELGKIMYPDYKQVGTKLHSDCLLKLYGATIYVA